MDNPLILFAVTQCNVKLHESLPKAMFMVIAFECYQLNTVPIFRNVYNNFAQIWLNCPEGIINLIS